MIYYGKKWKKMYTVYNLLMPLLDKNRCKHQSFLDVDTVNLWGMRIQRDM